MSFAQGAPTQPLSLLASNVFLIGNSTVGNAFTVQQLGTGNVASFVTSTGTTSLFINPSGNVGIGNTTPQARLWVPATSTSTGIGVYNADVAMIFGNTGGSVNSNTGSIQVKAGGSSTSIGSSNYNLTLNPDGGNVGVGIPTGTAFRAKFHIEQGQMFIGNSTYAWNTAPSSSTASGYNLRFDTTYNGTAGTGTICNKISLFNDTSWQAGFSVENNALAYHSGGNHTWYTGTTGSAYGTQRMQLTSAGALTVSGNITAFSSDKRLKKKTGPITDPLDKVCRLEGFTYVHNEIARENGFTDDRQYVGLSAQDLQEVLPEVVFPAPFDDGNKSGQNFLTVQYERIVPLLVEAIKEERTKREALENRLTKLEKLVLQE